MSCAHKEIIFPDTTRGIRNDAGQRNKQKRPPLNELWNTVVGNEQNGDRRSTQAIQFILKA